MPLMIGAPGMCPTGVSPRPLERLLTHTEARVKHYMLGTDRLQRLRSDYSTSNIKKALKENRLDQIEVREGGCRDVVLTFNSQEELKSNIHSIKEWFQDWSQFVLEWKLEVHVEHERCVWLRCQGIPLNLWNRNTLNNIRALWRSVFNLEVDISHLKSFFYSRIKVVTSCMELIKKTINLECKGKLHPIPVYEDHLVNLEESISLKHIGTEDCSSNVNLGRVVEANSTEVCYKEKEDEAEMAEGYDLSGTAMAFPIEVAQRKELTHYYIGEEVDTVVEETSCDVEFSRPSAVSVKEIMMEERAPRPKSNDNSEECVEQALTPGFFKSLSRPKEGLGPGINLEVDLAHPRGEQLVQDQGQVRPPAITINPLRNAKKTGKKRAQMEGFSRFARLYGHKAVAISKHTSKFVIFRPVVAALAQSDLSEGDSSSHSYLLKEAKAIVQLGKSLGINFRGKEDL
ncbi:hypothetical protein ACSBR1_019131 [Camellia fascicularis]